jgi:hypothetical protein
MVALGAYLLDRQRLEALDRTAVAESIDRTDVHSP